MLKAFYFILALSIFQIKAYPGEVVKLVTGNDYAPFTDEHIKGKGLFTQLVEKIVADAGLKSSLEFAPWKRAETFTESGEYMATFPYMETSERKDKFKFSDPVYVLEAKFIVNSDSNIKFNSKTDIEGLKGKIYCKPKGYGVESFVAKLEREKYLTKREPANMMGCVTLLQNKEVDLIPEAPIIFNNILDEAKIKRDTFKTLSPTIQETALVVMVTKKDKDNQGQSSQEFLDKFNASLKKLKGNGNNGVLKKIEDDYFAKQ